MEVMTSYDTIPEEERQIYEELIPNSMKLLKSLEMSFKGKPIIGQYLNVLFYFRNSAEPKNELNNLIENIRTSGESGFKVSMPMLHKAIITFLSMLDSALDILDKFSVELKRCGIKGTFSRKVDDVCVEINVFRNQVLHDKVLTIGYFSEGQYKTCGTDLAGYRNIQGTIRIGLDNSQPKKELGPFLTHTFVNTQKIIKQVFDLLLDSL